MDYTISRKDLEELPHKDIVKFALFCANQVEEDWYRDNNAVECVNTVKLRLSNGATAQECMYIANFTCNYLGMTSYSMKQWNAVRSAMFAAYAAGHNDIVGTAYYANEAVHCINQIAYYYYLQEQRFEKERWYYYNQLNTVSNVFEKLVLEGG